VLGLDSFFSQMAPLPAYVGLGAGAEFIPYFWAILAWAGAALLAVLQWPLGALLRCFSKAKGGQPGAVQGRPVPAPVAASAGPESRVAS